MAAESSDDNSSAKPYSKDNTNENAHEFLLEFNGKLVFVLFTFKLLVDPAEGVCRSSASINIIVADGGASCIRDFNGG